MGVSGAVQSLMGVMAPTIAGILYQVNTIYMIICYECTLIFFKFFRKLEQCQLVLYQVVFV